MFAAGLFCSWESVDGESRRTVLIPALSARRMDQRYHFPPAAPIDAEVPDIGRDYRITRVEFAQSNQTKVGEIRLAVGVAASEFRQPVNVFRRMKRRNHHAFLHER